jgi:hypothetical protein
MIIMEENFITGSVRGVQYRKLLHIEMTQREIKASLSITNTRLLTVAMENVLYIKQLRNILFFGMHIVYKGKYGNDVLKVKTWNYPDWCGHFTRLGVRVLPHKGWFDFG